jgi:hypothetical protein
VLADTVTARSRAYAATVSIDGEPVPQPPPPGPRDVQVAGVDANVTEALEILGRADPAPDWIDLWKVFEVVRDAVPGLEHKGWISKADLSAFRASANRPDVSGADARHARMPASPPKRTMTVGEARALIGVLVAAWLDSLHSP